MDYGKEYTEDQNKEPIGIMGILCSHRTVAGALVWALLKIMASGTEMIWEWIPERIHIPYYTVLVCTVGGAIIGIFRKLYGDYPEDMETVMGKVKKEKRYEYKNMLVMMIAALLPLLIGSSVGPEAGLTGIICRLMLLGRRESEICKTEYKGIFIRSVQPFPLVCYFMRRYLGSLRWKKIRICSWQSLEKDRRSSYMELHLQPEPEAMRDFPL